MFISPLKNPLSIKIFLIIVDLSPISLISKITKKLLKTIYLLTSLVTLPVNLHQKLLHWNHTLAALPSRKCYLSPTSIMPLSSWSLLLRYPWSLSYFTAFLAGYLAILSLTSSIHFTLNQFLSCLNPLAAEFWYPPICMEIIFLHTFTWNIVYVFIITVWQGLFFLVLTFPRLSIEAQPLFTVQGTCIYKIFIAENQKTQFLLLFIKPNIDKNKFSSCQGWCIKPSIDKHKFSFLQGW